MTGTDKLEAPAPGVLPPFTQASMEAYLAVSGDVNPLHVEPDLAERLGLDGLPVPGMLVMAAIANYLAQWPRCRTTKRLGARFTTPVYVDSELAISARIVRHPSNDQPNPVFRVVVTQNAKIAVFAEAELELA